MKREKEFADNFNKPSEAIRYFEQLLKSPKSRKDTTGLGYVSNEEGESSKVAKERNTKLRTLNLHVIIVERRDIHLMFAGVRKKMIIQRQSSWHTIKNARSKDIRHKNVGPKSKGYQNLKDTVTAIRSMDIKHLNADPRLHGHQTR